MTEDLRGFTVLSHKLNSQKPFSLEINKKRQATAREHLMICQKLTKENIRELHEFSFNSRCKVLW